MDNNKVSRLSILRLIIMVLFIHGSIISINCQNLPEDYPEMNVLVHDDPEPGYIFLSPCSLWGYFPNATPYLTIIDNYGTPIYYLKLSMQAFDFKLQPNGYLSFHEGGFGYSSFLMDSSYSIIKTVTMKNYWPDFHDFRVLENGNYLMIGWDDRLVDMDTVVPGGHPDVTVRGTAIQEQDPDGNIVWEWSSWDHYKITDANEEYVNLTDPSFIDYAHTNAIDQDTDTTMLISPRNMDEITKINKNTGEIIWRLGGKNNEFIYTGDTLGFSAQHHIRRLPNGNYLLFDNGLHQVPEFSSALEFELDEVNKIANFIKRYRSQPEDIFGLVMGSSQRLAGGNTLIGWGSGVPGVTEFRPDGTKTLEIEFEAVSYRAFKFPWETNFISFDCDTLNFGEIHPEDSLAKTIYVNNNMTIDFHITTILNNTGKYKFTGTLPVTVPPGGTEEIAILFVPEEEGIFNDVITICWDIENDDMTRRIAKQFYVKGVANKEFGIETAINDAFSIYPNPCTESVRLRYLINGKQPARQPAGSTIFDLYQISGKKIKRLLNEKKTPGTYEMDIDVSDLAPGVYFIRMQNGKQVAEKKLIVK